MIFRFGRSREEEFDEEDDDEERDLVMFQGALDGEEANLAANARLVEAGLVPAKEMVTDALLRRAERLRLEPKGKVSVISLYIDGVPYPGGRLPGQQALAVTQMIKLLSGMDIRERKKPQSGGVRAELQEKPYELRVASAPLPTGGERLVISIRDLKRKLDSPEEIGISDRMKATIREIASERHGLIMVCGPPWSGTTTTTLGVVRSIDAYMYNIFSIADLDGRELAYVNQFEINPGDDLNATLTRCMRVDADVIVVNPLRDAETAKLLFEKQAQVTLITELVAKEAKDAPGGIVQLASWVGPKGVADGLRAIISQKLIRLVCKDCREAYRPNPKLVAQMGLPPETKVLYRPPRPFVNDSGEEEAPECDTCGGTGYYGQTAIFEMIEMSDSMKKLVASGGDPAAIRSQARKEKMLNLQQEGLRLVAAGKTSLEEIKRVFRSA